MKSISSKRIKLIAGMFLAVCAMPVIPALGQMDDGYELGWQTVSGGGQISGGEYEMKVSVGPAGQYKMSGGEYEMVVSLEPDVPIRHIDIAAFADFAEQWLGVEGSFTADLDGDDDVDLADFGLLAERWLDLFRPDWDLW